MPSQFKNIEIQDTGFLTLPSGTSSERPASPASGMIRYNTDLGRTEWYDSDRSDWFPLRDTNQFVSASGGTVVDTAINGRPYRLHYFTETGTDTLTVTAGGEVEYLVVAGGGGGGNDRGGGGGAGGVLTGRTSVASDSISILVGAGGTGSTSFSTYGTSGNNSEFGSFAAIGGGVGGSGESSVNNGQSGGSGGGGGTNGFGANGTSNQGNAGGDADSNRCGGGGGAGSLGQDATGTRGGNGGVGIASFITGNVSLIAGGGGGGAGGSATAGKASYGGGNGQDGDNSTSGFDALQYTGGGGGGSTGGGGTYEGGDGSSGIVIVRYPRDPDATYSQPDRTISSTLPGNFNIIEDGLILNLDAGNPISYPGSGSTWRDLAQENDGNILGDTFFSENPISTFNFDGNDDRIDISGTTSINFNTEGAFEVWFKLDTIGGNQILTDDNDNNLLFYVNNSQFELAGPGFSTSGGSVDIASWYHLIVSWDSSSYFALQNGIQIVSGSRSVNSSSETVRVIGANQSLGDELSGKISEFRFYNKFLSNNMAEHNFNVTRGRFGV